MYWETTTSSHLVFGRAIILERALVTQLQLDVKYTEHDASFIAADAAIGGFDGGRMGMQRTMRGLVDGTRPPQEVLDLGVFSLLAHQVGEFVQPDR